MGFIKGRYCRHPSPAAPGEARVSAMPKVVNRSNPELVQGEIVYVGRGTNWGNPFIMKGEWNRSNVCVMFENYARWRLNEEPDWLLPLRGKNLECHCAPKQCHADTLLKLANQ